MSSKQPSIVTILVKYALRQPLTEQEIHALEGWRSKSAAHDALPEQFRDTRWVEDQRKQLHTPPTEEMWEDIRQYIEDREKEPASDYELPDRRKVGWARLSAAAILAVLIVVGGMKWWAGRRETMQLAQAKPPANYKLLLTLDDGSMVDLDTLAIGKALVIDGLKLAKTDSNRYVYSGSVGDSTIRHQLTVADRAGVCRLQWADGSVVWLRPGSNLNYPVNFRAAQTEMDGEGYFTVAHDPDRPVTIASPDGSRTRVLGTSFDLRTAEGEHGSQVALFSGSVRVVKGADSVTLKPGLRAVTTGTRVAVQPAMDSNVVLAWLPPRMQSDYFEFENADLLTVLPEIAGWYRLKVVNPRRLPGVEITGEFMHTLSLANIIESLKKVEGATVRLTLRQDTIFVAPLKPG